MHCCVTDCNYPTYYVRALCGKNVENLSVEPGVT